MKKLPLIILIILGICIGSVIFAYDAGIFAARNGSLAAGLSDWIGGILGGFDCAERIARCTSDMAYCQRSVEEERKRCDDLYNRYISKCSRYEEKAESYFTGCSDKKTQCMMKAERYRQKAESYEGEKRERYFQRYRDYLSGCEQRYSSCYSRAQQRKEQYLQTAARCRQRAQDSKDKCENRYLERQARKIEQCIRRGRRCLERLIDRCGSLVPSI